MPVCVLLGVIIAHKCGYIQIKRISITKGVMDIDLFNTSALPGNTTMSTDVNASMDITTTTTCDEIVMDPTPNVEQLKDTEVQIDVYEPIASRTRGRELV